MAETLAVGTIEIVGDARKLRASIEDAKKSLRTLGEGQRDISKSASASIDRYIGQLQAQNQLVGKSAREQEIFKLALRGASQEQLRTADAALKFREAQERSAATLQSLKSGFIAFGAVAVAALGAAAIAFDNLVKSASNFQDLAEKTGDTGENIASLAVAAKVGGIGISEVADASVRLTKNLTGVDDEADAAGAAIKALGLDIGQFKRLAPSDQIETIAKALAGFEDGASKAAVAVALFGKAGAQMLPFLKELAGETGRQNILTQEQIELADEYADKQARLQGQIELQAQAIAINLLPAYNDLQGAFLDVIKGMAGVTDGAGKLASDKSIQNFADNAARAFAFVLDALDGVVRAFQIAGKSIGGFGAVMDRIVRLDFRGALEAASAFREDISSVLNRQTFQGALESRIAARAEGGDRNQTPPRDRPRLNFQGAAKKAKQERDESDALRRVQLQTDIDAIRKASEEQINIFQNSERVLQALRSAALVDDQQYFEAKRAFIQLNSQESERALQAEIARLQQEVFTGKNADKERLENARKIADAQAKITKLQNDAATSLQINSIEQQAALKRIEQSLNDARIAAQDYLETIQRANAREIAGIGRGRAFRDQQAGLNAIEDRALAERRRLQGELRRQQITREQFDIYIGIVEETFRREVEIYEQRTRAIEAAQSDWLNGANEALQNYVDETRNIAGQVEQAFTRAFGGLEDLLVDITSGGIKSFEDLKDAANKLATSIVADVNRILIKQNITAPLAEFIQGQLGGIGSIFGLPRGGNAPTAAGGIGQAANDAKFGATIAAASTSFSASVTAAGTTTATELTAAGATIATELTTAAAAQATELTAAGAAFSAEIAAAGAAFATSVTGAGGASGGAGLIGSVLDSFATGTQFVPKTGPYLLHQGEAVIPKGDNMRGGDTVNITANFGPGTDRRTVDYAISEMERRMGNRQRKMSVR